MKHDIIDVNYQYSEAAVIFVLLRWAVRRLYAKVYWQCVVCFKFFVVTLLT